MGTGVFDACARRKDLESSRRGCHKLNMFAECEAPIGHPRNRIYIHIHRDPSIQPIPTLGPTACNDCLQYIGLFGSLEHFGALEGF